MHRGGVETVEAEINEASGKFKFSPMPFYNVLQGIFNEK